MKMAVMVVMMTLMMITVKMGMMTMMMIMTSRLFQRVSCESGYSSASPTLGLTGNMQLSNR